MRTFELTTRMKMVKRSEGRSATAAAAYRAAERIHCERENKTHDYTRKQGVEHVGIVLPNGSPAMTRAELWNAAEGAENRKNSQTAREYLFSLPDELSADGRRQAVEKIAAHLVERHGVAVDYAIHAPHREGDQRNHHCHMLMTTRRVERGELTDKAREFDDRKTGPAITKDLRAFVADTLNRGIEREQGDGRTAHVEHRSFEERGIEREPQQHQGVARTNMERRGVLTEERKREFAARSEMRATHDHQKAQLAKRHEVERSKHYIKWAQEGRERIERIKADLEKAERADAPQTGLKRLVSFFLGRTARENDERIMRSRDRHDLAGRQIEGLRLHYRGTRESLLQQQNREREEQRQRQGGDRQKMEKALAEKRRLDEIRRTTGRDLARERQERMKRAREQGGRTLTLGR